MQEIAYRVEADDVVAFNVHVTENARGFRQLLLTVAVVVAVALYWMVSAGSDTVLPALLTAVAGAAIYLVAAPRVLRFAVGRIIRRRLGTLGSRLLGDHELEITTSALVSRSALQS